MRSLFRPPSVFVVVTVAAVAAAAGWIGGVVVTRSQVLALADAAAARVGERAITLAEVDDRWRQDDPREQGEAMRVLYEGRRAALERLIADALIADGAARARVPVGAFVESAVGPSPPPSDADVLAFYASNRERLPRLSFDDLRPEIAKFLVSRQRERTRAAVVNDLARTGPQVRIGLEAPRWPVGTEPDDPAKPAMSPSRKSRSHGASVFRD